MEQVIAFRAKDGKLFQSEKEALQYELVKDFRDNYYENRLFGNYAGSYVEANDLIDWVKDNKDFVLALLSV